MATSTLVPLEEYLHTVYEYDCEWVDGELKERALPDELHSTIVQFFAAYFENRKRELGVRVRCDLRVKVLPRSYRVPDVTLLRADAPFKPIPTDPPVLCIEVLSPDDRPGERNKKIAEYITMGVGAIWIVDPRRRTMATADASGTHAVGVLELEGTSVRITKTELFAELDELEATVS